VDPQLEEQILAKTSRRWGAHEELAGMAVYIASAP
jgi:hypothetical protein